MSDTTRRLTRRAAWDQPRAFVVISEAVWWVTIVDATLVRHHLDAYDAVLAGQNPALRDLTEETLGGLRFVRNRIGDEADLDEFIEPGGDGPDDRQRRITGWTWKPVPEPKLASLPPRGQAWEMTRHRAYQAQLASHTIGETFGRAATFLKQAAAARITEEYGPPTPPVITCPACGKKIEAWLPDPGEETTVDCASCGQVIRFRIHVNE